MDVADVNQQRWLWENGQRLENVDQTLLVLSSGKPVPQKGFVRSFAKLSELPLILLFRGFQIKVKVA